jgi:diguanylate cyclase (GGDEF)-like protein
MQFERIGRPSEQECLPDRKEQTSVNRISADVPVSMVVGAAAIAALAAVGLLTLVPLPGAAGMPAVGVGLLTVLLTGGLVVGNRRMVEQARREARVNATRDARTGLATPFAAEQMLEMEFAAAQRGRPLALVLIRLEQFPRYRATHGRAIANQLLRLTGRALAKNRRGMHLTAHHGPGEGTYLSILSGMDLDGACVYARRIRRELMSLRGLPAAPNVSVGIVAYDMSMTSAEDLVEQAERALVKASAGGGKILVYGQVQTALVAD